MRSSKTGVQSLLLAVLLGAGASGCAPLQRRDTTEADKAIAAHNAKASPEEQITCRRERTPGSARGERICLTKAQWRERRSRARDQLRQQRIVAPPPETQYPR